MLKCILWCSHTTRGPIRFNVWDTAGLEQSRGGGDQYYKQGQCAVIMFDVTRQDTYENVPSWHRDIVRVCENIPIVLCGNKVVPGNVPNWYENFVKDSENISFVQCEKNKVEIEDRQAKTKYILQYYDVSAKLCYNFEKPFLWLARELIGAPDLKFVAMPSLIPLVVKMDPLWQQQKEKDLEFVVIPALVSPEVKDVLQWQQKMEKDLKKAQDTALSEDDEDL